MQARFLIGPAGSGKTFRCLAEIRAALARSPDGPPLILLAPKQATFQLERQLLATDELAGCTRLHILSFDRLAQFIFEQAHVAPPPLLSAEGRLMVLRALLRRHEGELKLFRGSARRTGFAQELGTLLAELQQHQFTPAKLRLLGENEALPRELRDKLHDLALLLEKYSDWLTAHGLHDVNLLLEFATAALRRADGTAAPQLFQQLWLDGFAEMTPQELALLAAVVPRCEQATLAFCLETEPLPEASWLSIWSAIGQTFQACRAQLANQPGCEVSTEKLDRRPGQNRFAENSPLAELELNWSATIPPVFTISPAPGELAVVRCDNVEAEATLAAREVLKFVRAGHRFRDCAVLVRQLEGYHHFLARAFRRYGIPYFLDRRESVTHHPLAELTRNALRTVAFDWRQEDWFAALKAGFTPVAETDLDRLENAALEAGWRGKKWREPLPEENSEHLRSRILPPYERLCATLEQTGYQPDGGQLAAALRTFWNDLDVEPTLERWTLDAEAAARLTPHATVWEQMNAWLDNVALAFPSEPMPLRDWLPVLEAGLANLSVGVIPPVLDEVLIGAIDRARNPSLKFALLLGMNESVFPAAPALPVILTNSDRTALEQENVVLGQKLFDQISRERYLGYIACTRANERLLLAFSRQGADGSTLNPSTFIALLQRIFPALTIEDFSGHPGWDEAEHASELIVPLVAAARSAPVPGRSNMNPADRLDIPTVPASPSPAAADPLPAAGHQLSFFSSLDAPAATARANPTPDAPSRTEPADSSGYEQLLEFPAVKALVDKLSALREPAETEMLSPALAAKLYGPVLHSSVSRLEEFAQCPFKFFIRSGLRANERKVFELDARERGNFQHDVLKVFHEQLQAEGKRWRDLTPLAARERIGQIAAAQIESFNRGLLAESPATSFTARSLAAALQDFVEVIVTWQHTQNDFDPAAAEIGFGGKDDATPAWKIDLGQNRQLALQGRIDRVDLWRDPAGNTALAVVTDYKSGGKKLDPLFVENGIQLQLLAYLGALRQWPNPAASFGVQQLVPAGAFYVSLRGTFKSGDTRAEVLADTEAKSLAYRHNGRFDAGELRKFDRRPNVSKGDQFNFKLNKDGGLPSNSTEALPRENFLALVDAVEGKLRELGDRIFSGATAVDPYRRGKQTPCDYCDYRAVCRLDEWTHEWRQLRSAEPNT